MDYADLEHAIRAACTVAGDKAVWVFGDNAILGTWHDAPSSVRDPVEVDIQPVHATGMTVAVDGALGEGSMFHAEHGFCVHGVGLVAGSYPAGWESRAVPVSHPVGTRGLTGRCLDPHDVAAAKLLAGREKDLYFARTLLGMGLLDAVTLRTRLCLVPSGREDAVGRSLASLAAWDAGDSIPAGG